MHALPARADATSRSPRRFAPIAGRAAKVGVMSPARELARRRVVRLVFAVYLLAIFEGALRKYVLPEFGQYIFFVRDPLVAWAFVIATRWRLWPRRELLWGVTQAAAVLGGVLLVLQVAFGPPSDLRLLLGAYGWRAYFFYTPLAFLVGTTFERDDLRRLARVTLLLAVPIAVLVTAQFFSSPDAPINVGTAEDKLLQFQNLVVDTTHVRPAGPFSSNVGQGQFDATAFAMLLALMVTPAVRRRVGLPTLVVGGAAVLACVALSGSRGTMLQVGMVLAFAVPLALLVRGGFTRTRAALIPAAIGIGAVVLYPIVFPESFAAFMLRWNTAASNESEVGGVFGRALLGIVDFTRLTDVVPPLGFGLGFGGNAAVVLKATIDGVQPGVYAESDFSRHMVDLGPFLGILYIAFRVAFVGWLLQRVVRATWRSSDPLPLMLFGYVGYVILVGQITGNGSINIYGWLFAGVCIAACRAASAPVAAAIAAPARMPGRVPTSRRRPPLPAS